MRAIRDVSRWNGLTRRDAVLLTASVSAAALFPSSSFADTAPALPDHIIDAHCHVFNAHDLPAAQYTYDVVAREHGIHNKLARSALGAMIATLKKFTEYDPEAKFPKDDESNLAKDKPRDADYASIASHTEADFEQRVQQGLEEIARNAKLVSPRTQYVPSELQQSVELGLQVHGLQELGQPSEIQLDQLKVTGNYESGILDELSKYYEVDRTAPSLNLQLQLNTLYGPTVDLRRNLEIPLGPPPGLPKPPSASIESFLFSATYDVAELAKKIAKRAKDLKTGIDGLFALLEALTNRRQTNIDALDHAFQDYDVPRPKNRFYAAATVDFDCWFGPRGKWSYPLADQGRIMAALARRHDPNIIVAGYMAFDPLRAVLHEEKKIGGEPPFAIVERAILEQGYSGVKIYPPMGFRAMGNYDPKEPHDFGENVARWGLPTELLAKRIDWHLEQVYRFCLRKDVPILTHTSNSQSTFSRSAENAEPKYWLDVLNRTDGGTDGDFKNLRLNLGHFGGFTCHTTDNAVPSNDIDSSDARCGASWGWTDEIIKAVAPGDGTTSKYPNLYFDISDDRELIESKDQAALIKFLVLHGEDIAKRVTEHMLFGTDWMFLVTAGHPHREFRKAVNKFVSLLHGSNVDVFTQNAAHFLGLEKRTCAADKPRCNTYARLVQFYQGDSNALETLDAFAVAPRASSA